MSNKAVTLVAKGGDTEGVAKAKAALSPALNAAIATDSYQCNLLGDDVPLMDLVDVLTAQTKLVQDGDLSGLEAMLVGQATALQSIFASLVRRAQVQTQQKNLEAFLSLGMKAQAQSRATIQALVELKYPRQVQIVKQTNVAHGPQQVNNGASFPHTSRTHAHVSENRTQQTELLEEGTNGGAYLDSGTTTAAGRSDPTLETVGTVHRPDKRTGQSEGITQRRPRRRVAKAP